MSEEAGAATEAAGETGTPAGETATGSMFRKAAGGEQPPGKPDGGAQDGGDGGEAPRNGGDGDAGGNERPDWLLPKYETVEDQAKAYRDLYGRFSKKTDDLRAEVLEEAVREYGKTIGVPEDPSGYEYPEGVNPPAEELDTTLREWARENNVSPEGFQKLINDVWMKTQPNYHAELNKLGENAGERLGRLNRWITANIDEKHFGAIERLMQTADGVEMMEAVAAMIAPSGFAPDTGQPLKGNAPKTREEIREMQADPRFGVDETYTEMVRNHWRRYAASQAR